MVSYIMYSSIVLIMKFTLSCFCVSVHVCTVCPVFLYMYSMSCVSVHVQYVLMIS